MTIKKLKTVKAAPLAKPAEGEVVADMPTGAAQKTAATIADRFKLDAADPKAAKAATASKRATTIALTAAVVALIVAGILTAVLYLHWDYLMPA